jgi:hypothetical protein
MVRFLAEIMSRFDGEIHFTPSNGIARQNNVYELDINPHPKNTYWTDWGGIYDNFTAKQIELYFGQFLRKVSLLYDMLSQPFSLFINENFFVYVNLPEHPWLYADYETGAGYDIQLLSAALNPDKPSDNHLLGSNAPVRLSVPDFTVKLSDNISGVVLNQDFRVALYNDDGYFDDEKKLNIFNTPLYLKKAVKDNPVYQDFKTIKVGLIESAVTAFDSFEINASDRLRGMDSPMCLTVGETHFLHNITDDKILGKNIPVVYGRKEVELLKLDETQYLAAEYISGLIGLYDSDGAPLRNYSYDPLTSIITSSREAKTAVIIGYADNRIGQIIKDLIERRAGIRYSGMNWNTDEADYYINSSARVNVAINSGDVKSAVQNILKNDMAFLIQQNDGRFTLRKYGVEYPLREIRRWLITKKPEKTWVTAQENYFSSCVINYDFTDKETFSSLLYSDNESEAERVYRRKVRKTFDTNLAETKDALTLAKLLAGRYSTIKQTVKVSVGADVSGYELLDTVIMPLGVNGRAFGNAATFIIKEINPAQDVLTLEEINIVFDVTGEYPYMNNHIKDYDNMYSFTSESEYEYILDGGGSRGVI